MNYLLLKQCQNIVINLNNNIFCSVYGIVCYIFSYDHLHHRFRRWYNQEKHNTDDANSCSCFHFLFCRFPFFLAVRYTNRIYTAAKQNKSDYNVKDKRSIFQVAGTINQLTYSPRLKPGILRSTTAASKLVLRYLLHRLMP